MGQCQTDGSCGSVNCEKLTFFASVLVLVFFVINAGIILMNRGIQDEIVAKQTELGEKTAKINQNATFENINRSLIQALAAAAITKKDEQIKALLIQNDVQLKPPGEGSAGAPQAPAKK
jgi:hypothetical protein